MWTFFEKCTDFPYIHPPVSGFSVHMLQLMSGFSVHSVIPCPDFPYTHNYDVRIFRKLLTPRVCFP